jgi:hypothetical protein
MASRLRCDPAKRVEFRGQGARRPLIGGESLVAAGWGEKKVISA